MLIPAPTIFHVHELSAQYPLGRGKGALSCEVQAPTTVAVKQFMKFTEDNDPYGTHDFCIFTVAEGEYEIRFYQKTTSTTGAVSSVLTIAPTPPGTAGR